MADFEVIRKLQKENKHIRLGVIKYLEMISSNPNKTDLEQTLDDFMQDRLVIKQLMKETFMSPYQVARIK